jgi:hypothetical protein
MEQVSARAADASAASTIMAASVARSADENDMR